MKKFHFKVLLVLSFCIASSLSESSDEKVKRIRELLKERKLDAYILFSYDPHMNENAPEHFQRIKFLTGFSGSKSQVVITHNSANIWVDSRYYIQVKKEIEENVWTVMKQENNDPDISTWLNQTFCCGSKIGYDKISMAVYWLHVSTDGLKSDIDVVGLNENLVDLIWKTRPKLLSHPLVPINISYTGSSISSKLFKIRNKMAEKNTTVMVLSSLSDIAWTLNLRGNDTLYVPVFLSYIVITNEMLYLFLKNHITKEVKEHFKNEGLKYKILSYDNFLPHFRYLMCTTQGNVYASLGITVAILELIPNERQVLGENIVAKMKAVKNEREAYWMRQAQLWDSVAIVRFLYWLEQNVNNSTITEISALKKLKSFRSEHKNYRGDASRQISSFGPNAAINHYSPTDSTSLPITADNFYLFDTCGQYGTTDVSRTVHFGNATLEEKKFFTLVLKGIIKAESLKSKHLTAEDVDKAARSPLKEYNFDYGHATGHGIGAFLNVHENPPALIPSNKRLLQENYFTSIEPGYYKEHAFGIRLENIYQVIKNKDGSLGFKTMTLVPYQTNLIITSMLDDDEIAYINNYHSNVFEALKENLSNEERTWLETQTLAIQLQC